MRNQETSRQQGAVQAASWRFNKLTLAVAMALGGVAAIPGQALAAAPDAGVPIGNTASATYTDASAVARNVTSNQVQTTVLQVASFTLTTDGNKYVTLGGQVAFPHTLTNTGNGTDTFVLSLAQLATDQFDLNNVHIYDDADGNGVADNTTAREGSTISLPRNGQYKFVVVGYAPASGVLNGNTSQVVVTADSRVYQGVPGSDPADVPNTDTATITADAVINVTKAADVSIGPTGTVITYTLTYTNTGNNTARNVTLVDAIPAGTTYVNGSGLWNGATLTDGAGGDPSGIAYDYNVSSAGKVTAVVASVAPNVKATVKFQVVVNANTAPGINAVNNVADVTYDPDNNAGTNNDVGPTPTNVVPFTVQQTADVAANESTVTNAYGGVTDTYTVASANQGAIVTFLDQVWNRSNGSDTFNITYSNASFPAGTAIQLFKADGVTPLQDSNGDGIPDTGPVSAGGRYQVVVKATLPNNASGDNGGLGYDMTVTAASTVAGAIAVHTTDAVTNHLNTINASTVDISNAGGLGAGTGPAAQTNGGNPWTTKAVNPGASATFVLNVQNTSSVADNYDLLADKDGTFGGTNDLPAGWSATFYQDGGAGDCSTLGASVTNTGTLTAGATGVYCGVVAVPATAAATPTVPQSIYFQAKSATTGSVDFKLDAVSVNTVRSLQMINDNSGQVFPGGTVVYTHRLTNLGNIDEGVNAGDIVLSATNTLAGFTTILYYDTDGSGTLTAADQQFTDISALTGTAGGTGLQPGEQIRIFAKVQAPGTATPGTSDTATIVATTTNGPVNGVAAPAAVTNLDVTQVIGGQIRLDKTQALDSACDGTADTAFSNANLSAKPGECLIYRVAAQNQGVSPVTSVVISDATPTFTTLESTALAPSITAPGTITSNPGDGNAGTVQATIATINGGASVTLEFEVKIDN